MSVRGRSERMAFAASFKPTVEYRTLYPSPSVYYPIVGAVCKPGPREPYIAFEHQEEPVATQADACLEPAGATTSCEVDDESCDDDVLRQRRGCEAQGTPRSARHLRRASNGRRGAGGAAEERRQVEERVRIGCGCGVVCVSSVPGRMVRLGLVGLGWGSVGCGARVGIVGFSRATESRNTPRQNPLNSRAELERRQPHPKQKS